MHILDTISCFYLVYWYLVLNFGNVENLGYVVWAMGAQVIFSSIPTSAVQLFYARRVYLVSQSLLCPVIITILSISGNCLAFYLAVDEITAKPFSDIKTPYYLKCLGIGIAVLGDILVATMMCWALYRKKTGFARTDSVIMTLMAYSLNSGFLTSALGSVLLITFAIAPNTLIWMAVFWVMCKCYIISLLAMLNSRDHIRDQSTSAYSLSSRSRRFEPPISVSVHRSTASDFVRGKSDHKDHIIGPTLEVPKVV